MNKQKGKILDQRRGSDLSGVCKFNALRYYGLIIALPVAFLLIVAFIIYTRYKSTGKKKANEDQYYQPSYVPSYQQSHEQVDALEGQVAPTH